MLLKRIHLPVLLPIRHKINHLSNCTRKCLVYLLTCWVCFKHYIGQTASEFANWYKSNNKKYLNRQSCFQEHVFDHFHIGGQSGFFRKCFINIEKMDPSNLEKRENIGFKNDTLGFKCFRKQYLIEPWLQ